MKLKLISILFLGITVTSNAQTDTCLTSLNLGISFPPVADSVQRAFANTHLSNLGVNKIRFAENWALREPTQGNFNWAPLDQRINWAFANNYDILLTIQSNASAWACSSIQNAQSCVFNDDSDFKVYIDSLLQRYGGKIDRIQFGNEWQSHFWYAGSAQNFIAANNILYESTQIYSPGTEVVLGGFTTISLRFMAGCNGYVSSFYDDDGNFYDAGYLAANCSSGAIQDVKKRIDSVLQNARYDVLDIHLYDDVEQWGAYFSNFSSMITKPIIVSEFGGPNMNYEPYSEVYQAERLFKYIKKLDSLPISDAYFFKLVEGTANLAHQTSGLIADTTLVEKQAYNMFKAFNGCVTSVGEVDKFDDIIFFPNPMTSVTSVTVTRSSSSLKELYIYSTDGKLVRNRKGILGNTILIKRNGLRKGLYFVKVRDRDGTVFSGRLMVN